MGEEVSAACKHCGTEELDHRDDCPAGAFGRVRLSAATVRHQESEILRLRAKVERLEFAEITRASCCVENEQEVARLRGLLRRQGVTARVLRTPYSKADLAAFETGPYHDVEATRLLLAQALIYAYRDARREGIDPGRSMFVLGILRDLDALYPRAPYDPPPEKPERGNA